jgi:hypothetical protein
MRSSRRGLASNDLLCRAFDRGGLSLVPEQRSAVRQHCFKYVVRRLWVLDEEPVVTELIVDREALSTKVEVYPRLCDVVRQKCNVCYAIEAFDVTTQFVPAHGLRQLPKLSGAIVHYDVQ